jgi:hypothetical protein
MVEAVPILDTNDNGYSLNEILENNIKARNNPQTIRNYYHKLEGKYNEQETKETVFKRRQGVITGKFTKQKHFNKP